MSPRAKRLLAPLIVRAEHHLPALTRLRRAEPLPITLDRKRIYIVPTRFGLGFAVILLVMLLGALNYANNAALLLTCLLGAVAINSMLQTFRAMNGLRLLAIHPDTTEAGRPMTLELRFAGSGRPHPALRLDGWDAPAHFDVSAEGDGRVTLRLATTRRGWMSLPRLRVSCTWPFGWFRAWSWLAPAQRVLVYPRTEQHGPPLPPRDGENSSSRHDTGDEWSSLRDYQAGDPLRLIAWRASARSEELRVKTFEHAQAAHEEHISWSDAAGLDTEARIARLARWVTEAHRAGRQWSLQLPRTTFPTGGGDAHYHLCLRALAELP